MDRYPTDRYSLVAIRPESGRRHQIRRHFKHIFQPVIGDTTYGQGPHNRVFRHHFGIRRLLLEAHRPELPDPDRPGQIIIECIEDETWEGLLRLFAIVGSRQSPAVASMIR